MIFRVYHMAWNSEGPTDRWPPEPHYIEHEKVKFSTATPNMCVLWVCSNFTTVVLTEMHMT
jgi:hypothetical protein